MNENKLIALISIIFTFQSGYIQMTEIWLLDRFLLTLHSNLVIFKSRLERVTKLKLILYIPIWLYSNAINFTLCLHLRPTLHSNLVIFKLRGLAPLNSGILTLHSNLVIFKLLWQNDMFKRCKALHSNLVIFKFGMRSGLL